MDRLRSRQNCAYFLKVGFWNTVRDKLSKSCDVDVAVSHCAGARLFSEALSTIMACGRTGWLDDFSRAADKDLDFSIPLNKIPDQLVRQVEGARGGECSVSRYALH